MAAFWDVLPTFTALAGRPVPPHVDGLSLLPTFTGRGRQAQHPYLYWEFYEQGGSMAARQGQWKAVRRNLAATPPGPIELYDLADDPTEQHDVAGRQPALVARFADIFAQAHVPSPVFRFQPKKPTDE